MAKPNHQFEKRQRELAKQKKKEEKRQRKLDRTVDDAPGAPGESAAEEMPAGDDESPQG